MTDRESELLQQVEDMKIEFMSMISHELRTPLVALRSGTELLDSDDVDLSEDDRRALIRAIRRQSERLYEMIQNLIDISRMDQGHLRLKVEDVNVWQSIESVVHAAQQQTDGIEVQVPSDLVVVADGLYLGRIVGNLLANAGTYGRAPILLSAEQLDKTTCEIRVSDSGEGVPSHLVPTLFEKFTRGTRDGATPGSGLGLALVSALAAAFGGSVHYEAGTPTGATVVVTLQKAEGAAS